MTTYSGDVVRKVMSHCGMRDVDVAELEDLTVAVVRGVRLERRRNAQDGSRRHAPGSGRAQHDQGRSLATAFDYDGFMRSNDSVFQ